MFDSVDLCLLDMELWLLVETWSAVSKGTSFGGKFTEFDFQKTEYEIWFR